MAKKSRVTTTRRVLLHHWCQVSKIRGWGMVLNSTRHTNLAKKRIVTGKKFMRLICSSIMWYRAISSFNSTSTQPAESARRELTLQIEVDATWYHMVALRINLLNISAVMIFLARVVVGFLRQAAYTNWFRLIMKVSNCSRDLAWRRGGTTDFANAHTCYEFRRLFDRLPIRILTSEPSPSD